MNTDFGFDFEFDDEAFSDFELDLEEDFETRYIKPPRTRAVKEEQLKYSLAEKLVDELKIEKGDRYYIVVNGSFYFGDLIEALIVKNNWAVRKMTISTLSMNYNSVDSLANLLNGGFLKELNLIVSDFFFSHERKVLIPYIYQELDKENRFQLAVAGTHCKLCIFETTCGKYITIHGSANLRSSGNIEQAMIEEGKELYDFNDEYQGRIIEHYKTIEKTIRHKKLWNIINPNKKWQKEQDQPAEEGEAEIHRQDEEPQAG